MVGILGETMTSLIHSEFNWPLEDTNTTTEFQNEFPPEGQVLVNCHSNHNVSSITEETCDQDENIGDGPGKNGKDTNSTELDVDLPDEHFPNETDTGKSLSEALIFASTKPQYDNRLLIVNENCKLRRPAEHFVYTNCCFYFVLTFRTISVHNMFCRCCKLLKKIYL